MPPPVIVLLSLIVVLAVMTVILVTRVSVKRRRGIQEFVAAHDLIYEKKGDKAFRKAWAALPELPDRGNITNLIYGLMGDHEMTLFEHTHVVMAGNTPMAIMHTVAAAEISPGIPETHLIRKNLWRSLASALRGAEKVGMSDPEFDREWLVRADDPEYAHALLTPEVRALLRDRKTDRGWHFFGGKAAVVLRRQMSQGVLDDVVGRLLVVCDHIRTIDRMPVSAEGELQS